MNADGLFSTTYAQARQRFLDAAAARALPVETHVLPLPGVDGETLAVDVVLDGDPAAPLAADDHQRLPWHRGLLRVGHPDRPVARGCRHHAGGGPVAVLHVHALNPHGFSHGRRVTHENVDLNRNFIDFSAAAAGQRRLRAHPPAAAADRWPPSAEVDAALQRFPRRGRPARLAGRGVAGPVHAADGLYFGGRGPTWSNGVFRDVLRRHVAPRGTWPGSTCTPAWARAAWANASSRRSTNTRRWTAACAAGGGRVSPRSTNPRRRARAVRPVPRRVPPPHRCRTRLPRGEFVEALTKAGWLAALIPQEFGGSGLGLAEASVIMEEINRSGGNAGACHGQMYNMGTLLRHGSAAQKRRTCRSHRRGELRLQSMGVTEPGTGTDTTKIKTRR
jgi:hypothetical protein